MSLTQVGMTIAFGTSSFDPTYTGITPGGVSRGEHGISHLELAANAEALWVPGKLLVYEPWELRYIFDPDDIPPITAAAETLTITYQLPTGQSTAANLSGTGFVLEYTPAELEDVIEGEDAVLVASLMWRWDGATGPTWTASAI